MTSLNKKPFLVDLNGVEIFVEFLFKPLGKCHCATIVVLVKCYYDDCLRPSCPMCNKYPVRQITDVAVFINLNGVVAAISTPRPTFEPLAADVQRCVLALRRLHRDINSVGKVIRGNSNNRNT